MEITNDKKNLTTAIQKKRQFKNMMTQMDIMIKIMKVMNHLQKQITSNA
jgi:hypothetical protein